MKIAVVWDVHLSYLTPSTRIDDYPNTVLKKLSFIRDYCNENDIDYAFFLGDLFHQPQQPLWYLHKVIQVLNGFRANLYTLIGNHDIAYHRMERLPSSAMGILLESKVLNPIQTLELDGVHIVGINYGEKNIPIVPNPSILLAHHFYENVFAKEEENLTYEEIRGFNLVCTGHDHNQYDDIKKGNTTILRVGSLTRGTSHVHHLHRNIYFVEIDLSDLSYKKIEVPYLPSDQVFTKEAYTKLQKGIKESIQDFRSEIHNLVNNFFVSNRKRDIRDVIASMELEEEVYLILKELFLEEGVVI